MTTRPEAFAGVTRNSTRSSVPPAAMTLRIRKLRSLACAMSTTAALLGSAPLAFAQTAPAAGGGTTSPPPPPSPSSTPAAPAAAPSPPPPTACVPNCRSGYTCVSGQCVSACNPPCASGEQCVDDGRRCVATRPAAAPAHAAAAPPASPLVSPPNSAQPLAAPPAPGAAPPGTFPIRFVGPSGKQLRVAASGPVSGECEMPCTLQLMPGTTSIEVTGDFEFKASLDLPARAAQVEFDRRSRGMLITGAVLLGIATINTAYLTATGNSETMSADEAATRFQMAIGGVVVAVVGLVLVLASGKDKATVTETALLEGRGLAFRGFGVGPTQGGAAAAAVWSF
jgi:hypothetical protein